MPGVAVGKSPTPEDVLRSLRRFFSEVLPTTWDLQYQRDELERPGGFVVPVTPVLSDGSAYVRDQQRDFDVFLYPLGFESLPAKSRVEAEQLAHTVERALSQGVAAGVVTPTYKSRSLRLPVFDYTGVPWDHGVSATPPAPVNPPASPFDYLPVSNLSVDPRPDPEDDTLFTVVVGLRLSWAADGDTSRYQGKLLTNVRYDHEGS